jgi:hypothetical protein
MPGSGARYRSEPTLGNRDSRTQRPHPEQRLARQRSKSAARYEELSTTHALRRTRPVQFIYKDLGSRQRDDVVEVVLSGTEANVALVDSSTYSSFKAARSWRGVGGLTRTSRVHLTVPSSGHWYGIAFITPGRRGSTRAGFRVLPSAQPPPGRTATGGTNTFEAIGGRCARTAADVCVDWRLRRMSSCSRALIGKGA